MGVKRSAQRRQERALGEVLKRKFLPYRAEVPIECPACHRPMKVDVPAVPKAGGRVVVRTICECGNPVNVTLTGKVGADGRGT
jgi:hypothetical protein